MTSREQFVRTAALFACSPAVLALIAMIVVMRPLTAYQDHFHGPDDMWRDLRQWARTGRLVFPSWQHATRDRLPHPSSTTEHVERLS
jgi:hypothetical protein